MPRTTKTPKSRGSQPARQRLNRSKPTEVELRRMIEEAAYYRAEQRNFTPGFEELDWFEAEKEIRGQLHGSPPSRNKVKSGQISE